MFNIFLEWEITKQTTKDYGEMLLLKLLLHRHMNPFCEKIY